jgi:hypothetical protein
MTHNVLNWFYRRFLNPYKVIIGGYCPRQAEGSIEKDGKIYYYYFRARGEQWYLKVSIGFLDAFSFQHEVFHTGDRRYCVWPEAGYLPEYKCIILATKALDEFIAKKD